MSYKGAFESFVRSAFKDLNNSVKALTDENKKQSVNIDQLTKTVNKHSHFLSKIPDHEAKITKLTETVNEHAKDVSHLKTSEHSLRKSVDDQAKRNRQLENDLKAEKRTVRDLENLCLDLQQEVNQMAKQMEHPLDPLKDIDRCLIITNLHADEDENAKQRAQEVINSLKLDTALEVVKAVRMKSRTVGKPGSASK
ncbi:myosin heavy chain, cardiac muscle isoform-like [Lineus longissimus]|uniref:myosin heavy chain, cardiac muscle isoform-like n=1 Tax=Lineus longissimus TaxID=88925 RepID=UPI00315CFD36